MADDPARQSRFWAIWSLVGIGTWIAVTVLVTVTNDDPLDSGPATRAFAIGGGIFFAATFAAAGVQMRQARTRVASDLYRRLALHQVSDAELRAATRGLAGIGPVYLLFGAATTGLMLLAIGLNDADLVPLLVWAVVALVGIWLGYMFVAAHRAFVASDAFVRPLGLRLVGVEYAGERHGQPVVIRQDGTSARTLVGGAFGEGRIGSPQQMAELTGEPVTVFRRVTVTRGPEGVVVDRQGNGAGRWLLTDLLLAESVAGSPG